MPRKSSVSKEDAINVVKKYIQHFCSENLPAHSSKLWETMSHEPEFKGKWNQNAIRTNIKENRRNILSIAREECGYFITMENKKSYKDDMDIDSDSDSYEGFISQKKNKDEDYFYKPYTQSKKQGEVEYFDLEISRDVWESIVNVEKQTLSNNIIKYYPKLKPKVWTHTIAFEFWRQYRLKCAFVFRRGRIHEDGSYYATIEGHCKGKQCRNPIFGYIEKCPSDNGSVFIRFECRDTRNALHEDVQRPLRGKERQKLKTIVKADGVKGTILQQSAELLKEGETGCPFLYNANVLRQVKKESKEEMLGVNSEDRRDFCNENWMGQGNDSEHEIVYWPYEGNTDTSLNVIQESTELVYLDHSYLLTD